MGKKIIVGKPEQLSFNYHQYELDSSIDYIVYIPKGYSDLRVIPLENMLPVDVHHIAIIVDEGAHLSIFNSPKNSSDLAITIILKTFSSLIYKLFAKETTLNRSYSIIQEEQSHLHFFFSAIDTDQFNLNCHIKLIGKHAQAVIKGMHDNKSAQSVDIKTEQIHEAFATKSSVLIKGCVADSAQARYQGLVQILEGATSADAQQYSKHLLLSAQASAIAIPHLEIKTNEVQCKHGSAIGYVDAAQFFYLQTRGLTDQQSERILKEAFFTDFSAYF